MEKHIPYTDSYFVRTRKIIQEKGDTNVTYAIFMRRPVTYAPKIAIDWLKKIISERNEKVEINENFKEGSWVGAGEPMLYLSGKMSSLVDLETLFLQKLGPPCVAGSEMSDLMSYGASVGSEKAKRKVGAEGFIGCAADATAHFFGKEKGIGSMPHALIGYAGSTLNAAKMFHETFPNEPITILIDYFGKEITDGLEVCRHFKNLLRGNSLALRLDTHGGRYVEGLEN